MLSEIIQNQRNKAIKNRPTPVSNRVKKLQRLKEWIKTNHKEIEKALYADLKKPAAEVALTETSIVALELNLALKNTTKWSKPKKVKTPAHLLGTSAYTVAEPKGIVLIISPWNYPFNLALAPLVSAIAAGCSVSIKPSEYTPHTSALIRRMVSELFLPEDVAVFEGGPEMADTLLKQGFDHVFFTGSTQVGKVVMETASKTLTPVTLELGGKCPVIVDRGYDIKDAARKIAVCKFINSGQSCIAPDYLFVHESQKAPLIEALIAEVNRMYNPKQKGLERSKDYGRIVNEKHIIRLQNLLTDAQTNGAHVEFGGNYSLDQRFMEPTLISQVSEKMLLMQEEIFGPILPIITYSQLDDVVRLVQMKPKPLAVYMFTTEEYAANVIQQHTSSGALVINDCGVQFFNPELPFGGVGHSGMGRSHGEAGFLTFSNQKSVLKQRSGSTMPKLLYPPYGLKTSGIIKAFQKWILRD